MMPVMPVPSGAPKNWRCFFWWSGYTPAMFVKTFGKKVRCGRFNEEQIEKITERLNLPHSTAL